MYVIKFEFYYILPLKKHQRICFQKIYANFNIVNVSISEFRSSIFGVCL